MVNAPRYSNIVQNWIIRIQASQVEEGSETIIATVLAEGIVRSCMKMQVNISDIGSHYWNFGKSSEMRERKLHL